MKISLLSTFLALAALLLPGLAGAADLRKEITTPGTLAAAVGSATDATGLTVSGRIDVRDLDFIADRMTALTTLDLSAATICQWSGNRTLTGLTTCPANVLPAMSLAGCKASTIVLPKNITAIAEGALAGAAVTSIDIPATVTTIGLGAFADAPALTKVSVPASVTSPGEGMFRGCTALSAVVYGPAVVPAYAFDGCTALTTVQLPASLTTIANSAFRGCSSLSNLQISRPASSLSSIGDYAFYGTAIKALDLSEQTALKQIGAWAFADCRQLTELLLPARVNQVGDGAFFHDSALVSLTPVHPAEVGAATFKGAEKLDMPQIGGTASEKWGPYAFYGMTSLTDVNLPDNLTSIGDHAFDGCTSLKQLNGPGLRQVPQLGEEVWGDLDKSKVDLGVANDMVDEFKAAPVWNEFHILAKTDIESGIANPDYGVTVRSRFIGTVLEITSADTGHNLTRVEIYDIAGHLLHRSTPRAETTTIETGQWTNPLFLVRAELSDGTVAAAKLSR